jgi:UDPglucose--hexose-1-phosphate uridylyltransferase
LSELRWNPVLEEWVITATQRQDRTFFPPPEYCPLCPTKPGAFPTEIPAPEYDIVVFENKFPSLRPEPPEPAVEAMDVCPVAPAVGVCEVVVYSSDHNSELATMPFEKFHKLVYVWADRFQELGDRPEVKFVFLFENKGREIGVTLAHPHGQIYAYPFIPPIPERELRGCKKHYDAHGECLLCRLVKDELEDGRRIVARNEGFVAYIPFFARYPYEVHIHPLQHRPAITDFDGEEKRQLAQILQNVIVKYNRLWPERPSLPYIMVTHQRPTDAGSDAYPHYHYHIEFYPPYRTPDKLKFLAGSEAGAGAFINDTLAEEKATILRDVDPRLM